MTPGEIKINKEFLLRAAAGRNPHVISMAAQRSYPTVWRYFRDQAGAPDLGVIVDILRACGMTLAQIAEVRLGDLISLSDVTLESAHGSENENQSPDRPTAD